jgi:hypothetical protein
LSDVSTLPESSSYFLRKVAFLSIVIAVVVIVVKNKNKAQQSDEKSEV